MNDNEIAQARQELKALQDDIVARKRELSKLNEEKESWFQKRAEIGSKIADHIRQVKDTRHKRDELTKQVREEKKERREYSQDIRDKIAQVKDLRKQLREQQEKLGVDKKPGALKQEIEGIEYKLETSAMPYNEERKLTKILKDKKAAYSKVKGLGDLANKIRDLSKEIDDLKKQSDEVHETLQGAAEESQEFHENVIEKSKFIDDLKAEEEAAYKKFTELKDAYAEKRDALQALIDKADGTRDTLRSHGEVVAAAEKKNNKQLLKQKTQAVEEKVKKKQKLTTEDLLAFQAGE